jgi:hypothetical protein
LQAGSLRYAEVPEKVLLCAFASFAPDAPASRMKSEEEDERAETVRRRTLWLSQTFFTTDNAPACARLPSLSADASAQASGGQAGSSAGRDGTDAEGRGRILTEGNEGNEDRSRAGWVLIRSHPRNPW